MKSMFVVLMMLSFGVFADDMHTPLNSTEIIQLFSGKTAECIKESDQTTCSTFMGVRGQVKRFMHDTEVVRLGKWHAAGHKLCIRWEGKSKYLCFDIYPGHDGTYELVKRGKLKSTITGFKEGDQARYQD